MNADGAAQRMGCFARGRQGPGVEVDRRRPVAAAGEDEVLDERVRVLGAGEPGLVVDRQHCDLAAGHHVSDGT